MRHDDHDERAGPDGVEALLRELAARDRLDPQVRAAHLARVRARAAELGPAASGSRAPRRREAWPRVAAVAAGVALLVGVSGGGVAVAARDALPGEPLYGMKTSVEELIAWLRVTPEATTDDLLARAERRLDEAEALGDASDPELIAGTLASHARLLEEAGAVAAGDPALEAAVETAAGRAVERLESLLVNDLPDAAAQQARDALRAIIGRSEGRLPAPTRMYVPPAPRATPPAPDRPAPAPGPPAPAPSPPAPPAEGQEQPGPPPAVRPGPPAQPDDGDDGQEPRGDPPVPPREDPGPPAEPGSPPERPAGAGAPRDGAAHPAPGRPASPGGRDAGGGAGG